MRLLIDKSATAEVLMESTGGDAKRMHIQGNFLMHTTPNRNKRIYPKDVMGAAVEKYKKDYIDTHRSLGEMNHPPGRLQVDPERACILTTQLNEDGNYYYGKAKVLSTPLGKILEALLSDGVKIGVSSRGLGSTSKRGDMTHVGKDFMLTCAADVVWDPSVGDAFVEHLMEEKEYLFVDGNFVAEDIVEAKAKIRRASSVMLEEAKLAAFQEFLTKIHS